MIFDYIRYVKIQKIQVILKIKNLKTANRDRTKNTETRITQADRLTLTYVPSSGTVCRNILAYVQDPYFDC